LDTDLMRLRRTTWHENGWARSRAPTHFHGSLRGGRASGREPQGRLANLSAFRSSSVASTLRMLRIPAIVITQIG
jgi:hypothetical protein